MDELFKNNAYKIVEIFIDFPLKDFSIRGIARHLKLSHATVLKYMDDLEKGGFIRKKEVTLYPTYFANTENKKYKFYKKNRLIFRIMESGLIDYIQKETLPSVVILFGSGAKATFTVKSDIDVFVEASEVKIDTIAYEKKLKHKINLLFEQNMNNLSKELRNNIMNGDILYGFIKM